MATPSTRLRLRVVPGATATGIVGRYGEAWKVRVGVAPERGAANAAAVALIADAPALRERDVRVVSGYGARDKIVEVAGVTAAAIDRGLAAAERKDEG